MPQVGEVSILLETKDKSQKALDRLIDDLESLSKVRFGNKFANDFKRELKKAQRELDKFTRKLKDKIKIDVKVDDTKLNRSINDTKRALKRIENTDINTGIEQSVKKELDSTQKRIKNFTSDVKKNSKIQLQIDDEKLYRSLQETAKKINEVKNASNGFDVLGNKAENAARKVRGLQDRIDEVGSKLKNVGGRIQSTGFNVTAFTAPITAGLGLSIRSAINYEDQLADVRKTSGLTAEETEILGEQLRELAETSRTSTEELINIAVSGGRSGVAIRKLAEGDVAGAREELFRFTEAVNLFNVALGEDFSGGAEQATTEVSKLRNVLGDFKTDDAGQDLVFLGNAINVLTSQGQITAPVLTEMATRIAAGKGAAQITTPEILALASALEDAGVTAEVGGSSISAIFNEMSENSKAFAKVAGLSLDEFNKLLNTDTNTALQLVVEGLKEADLSTTEYSAVMKDLGLNSSQVSRTFGALIQNSDKWVDLQSKSEDALKTNNSLLDEYATKNENSAGAIGQFRNSVNNLLIDIGDELIPVMQEGIDLLRPLIKGFRDLPTPVKRFAIGVGLAAVALGPLLIIAGLLVSSLGTIIPVATAVGGAIASIGAPVIAIIAGGIALQAVLVVLAQKFGVFEKIGEKVSGVYVKVQNSIDNIKEAIQDPRVQRSIDRLRDSFSGLEESVRPIFDSIIGLIDALFGSFADTSDLEGAENAFLSVEDSVNILTGALEGLASGIDTISGPVSLFASIVSNNIDFIAEKIEDLREYWKRLNEDFEGSGLKDDVIELGEAFKDWYDEIEPLVESLGELKDIIFGTREETEDLEEEVSLLELSFLGFLGTLKVVLKYFTLQIQLITGIIRKGKELYNFFANFSENYETIMLGIDSITGEASENAGKKWDEFMLGVDDITDDVTNKVNEKWEQFTLGITSSIDDTKESATQKWETFTLGLETITNELSEGIRTFFTEDIPNGIEEGVNFVGEKLQGITTSLNNEYESTKLFAANFLLTFLNLPFQLLEHLLILQETFNNKFTEIKNGVTNRTLEAVTFVLNLFTSLPGQVSEKLIILRDTSTQRFTELKNNIITGAKNATSGVVDKFRELPGNVTTELGNLKNSVRTFFDGLAQDALGWGKNVANKVVEGIRSVNVSSVLSALNPLSGGGLAIDYRNYSSGGKVQPIYASGGKSIKPKGTDTVPAMLTPNERVLSVQQNKGFEKLIAAINGVNTRSVNSSTTGEMNKGIQVAIDKVYAGNADNARKRGGDIGYGLLSLLISKGLV